MAEKDVLQAAAMIGGASFRLMNFYEYLSASQWKMALSCECVVCWGMLVQL